MSTAAGKLSTVLVNEFDLSSRVSQMQMSGNQATADVTGMGVDDVEVIAGQVGMSLSVQGPWDNAVGQNEAVITTELGTTSIWTLTLGGGDSAADFGNRCMLIETLTSDWTPRVAHNDAVRYAAGGDSADAARFGGRLLHPKVSESATGAFASSDGLASSAFGAQAHLHVISFAGTSATIRVQDSVNDSTFADLITFTSVTGVGSERLTVAGNVDRYLRCNITAGTFTEMTFAVSAARNRI